MRLSSTFRFLSLAKHSMPWHWDWRLGIMCQHYMMSDLASLHSRALVQQCGTWLRSGEINHQKSNFRPEGL